MGGETVWRMIIYYIIDEGVSRLEVMAGGGGYLCGFQGRCGWCGEV